MTTFASRQPNTRSSRTSLASLQFDVSDCPGTPGPAQFDATRMALMGHSMGATIAPLVLWAEPLYQAAVLSGAGASWIENVLWKQEPLDVLPAFEVFLKYTSLQRTLEEDDPVLTLFQWAEDPADPLNYTRTLIGEPPPGRGPASRADGTRDRRPLHHAQHRQRDEPLLGARSGRDAPRCDKRGAHKR